MSILKPEITKNTQKNARNNILLKTKGILITEI